MKKEISKEVDKPKMNFTSVLEKYDAVFSLSLQSGFGHIKFEQGKMFVEWLNDEGFVYEEGHQVPIEDIERVADLMRDLKALRLQDYAT